MGSVVLRIVPQCRVPPDSWLRGTRPFKQEEKRKRHARWLHRRDAARTGDNQREGVMADLREWVAVNECDAYCKLKCRFRHDGCAIDRERRLKSLTRGRFNRFIEYCYPQVKFACCRFTLNLIGKRWGYTLRDTVHLLEALVHIGGQDNEGE
jgi:hypothetical protein